MRLFKALITVAIAAALLVVPAGALAKSRDRDRMPDKWEKKHHLNVHAKDARKDPDRDHLSNLSEFRHHTDPRKADTDDDGIRDDDELSGTITSFTNGVLTIRLARQGAGTAVGTVNAATRIECDDEDDDAHGSWRTATTSDDRRGGDDDTSGPGSTNGGHDGRDDDDRDDDERCTSADLKPGARVH